MKKIPPEVLAARPALADDPDAQHPDYGASIGPPPKRYTIGVHERIVELIEKFQRPVTAASMCGIPSATFYEWMRRGKEGDPHLAQFYEDVEAAMARAEGKAVEGVVTGPDVEPDDLKWWLERSRPEAFSKDVAMRVNAELEAFVKRLEAGLDPHTFEKVLAVFAGQSTSATQRQLPKPDDAEETE